jgi:hypothetical protein
VDAGRGHHLREAVQQLFGCQQQFGGGDDDQGHVDRRGRLQRDAVGPDGRKYHDFVRVAPAQPAFRHLSNRSDPNGREVRPGQIQRRVEDASRSVPALKTPSDTRT